MKEITIQGEFTVRITDNQYDVYTRENHGKLPSSVLFHLIDKVPRGHFLISNFTVTEARVYCSSCGEDMGPAVAGFDHSTAVCRRCLDEDHHGPPDY